MPSAGAEPYLPNLQFDQLAFCFIVLSSRLALIQKLVGVGKGSLNLPFDSLNSQLAQKPVLITGVHEEVEFYVC